MTVAVLKNKCSRRAVAHPCPRSTSPQSTIHYGVWSPADFDKELDRAMKESFTPDTVGISKEAAALCAVASLLFPDRLPLLLERML